jgi:hypothetical protein
MSLGKMEVLERPKSKWPYWVLYSENYSDDWEHKVDYQHVMLKIDLMRNKIPVVVERQWSQYTGWRGPVKKQYGVLYKFLKEEDRLIFLMSQETNNELH